MVRGKSPPFLFMPYFGKGVLGFGGAGKLQPIFVGDVARGFVEAIGNEKSVGKTYVMAGSEVMTWPQMHEAVAKAVIGKKKVALGIPVWYAKVVAAVVPGKWLPFNGDQVIMSQEDNVGSVLEFEKDFGWTAEGFESSLKKYAKEL